MSNTLPDATPNGSAAGILPQVNVLTTTPGMFHFASKATYSPLYLVFTGVKQ